MGQVNKKDPQLKESFSKQLAGDFYVQSIREMLEPNSIDTSHKASIKAFLESIHSNQFVHELNNTFGGYFKSIVTSNDEMKLKVLMHVFHMISIKLPEYSDFVVDALIQCLTYDLSSDRCVMVIHELGYIGHSNESTCNKIIDEINKITHRYTDHAVIMESIHVLYEIGLSWNKKKKIFFPLLDILKTGEKLQKLEAIRAIRTQLEGYWEKPIESLKDLVLYDGDFEVRRVAAMSLGEVGAYTSHSVREAIFELASNIANQIQRLKTSLKKEPINHFHTRCRLSDNKAILKILYHYIRVYKYGLSR